MSKEKDTFYSTHEHVENLWATNPEEAVGEYDHEPGPVKVYAWQPVEIRPGFVGVCAAYIEDTIKDIWHDHDYGDPEDTVEIPAEFQSELRALLEKHIPTLHVWHCERVPELDVVFEKKGRHV